MTPTIDAKEAEYRDFLGGRPDTPELFAEWGQHVEWYMLIFLWASRPWAGDWAERVVKEDEEAYGYRGMKCPKRILKPDGP